MVKYYFTVNGKLKETRTFENDAQAFEHRCKMEKLTGKNWKVYDERYNLIYGIAVYQ
jgi:hypothetical protein